MADYSKVSLPNGELCDEFSGKTEKLTLEEVEADLLPEVTYRHMAAIQYEIESIQKQIRDKIPDIDKKKWIDRINRLP